MLPLIGGQSAYDSQDMSSLPWREAFNVISISSIRVPIFSFSRWERLIPKQLLCLRDQKECCMSLLRVSRLVCAANRRFLFDLVIRDAPMLLVRYPDLTIRIIDYLSSCFVDKPIQS